MLCSREEVALVTSFFSFQKKWADRKRQKYSIEYHDTCGHYVKDGVQYITITARGGYTPEVSVAQSGIPTKLIVKTNGTYDCSSSLVIKSLNYQKILPQTGEEIIDLGIPKAGIPLQGVCGMGMYNFVINFS